MFTRILRNFERDEALSPSDAVTLAGVPDELAVALFDQATRARHKHFGNRIDLCSIINARSGNCAENCAFCAQSKFHVSDIERYPFLDSAAILARAKEMEQAGAHRFSIVISGGDAGSASDREKMLIVIEKIRKETRLHACASLGFLTPEWARRLRDAGLERYHHNIETAPSFYPEICTTHSIEKRLDTLRIADEAGLETCSGGIWGMGESSEQRVEMAFTLKNLPVKSIPINFLNPIPGTRLEKTPPVKPMDLLKMTSVFRLILPDREIRFAGGRELNLRQLLPLGIIAGASGLMVGNYLTTLGREVALDMEAIKDMGLSVDFDGYKGFVEKKTALSK